MPRVKTWDFPSEVNVVDTDVEGRSWGRLSSLSHWYDVYKRKNAFNQRLKTSLLINGQTDQHTDGQKIKQQTWMDRQTDLDTWMNKQTDGEHGGKHAQ